MKKKHSSNNVPKDVDLATYVELQVLKHYKY